MKRNITINLFGQLYAIDEDAYELLKKYLDNIKSYFAKREGGEEIADDIEHRVAELLWQKKEQGAEAVSIETVKEIISKIGNPAEIDNTTKDSNSDYEAKEETQTTTEREEPKSKGLLNSLRGRYLYRDPANKILGGVCSGVARFMGSDSPTIVRIATIIMTFLLFPLSNWFNSPLIFLAPIAYVIMWLIVPVAHSAEDRVRMKGKKVTIESINEEILSESDSQTEDKVQRKSSGNGCLSLLLKTILVIILLPFVMIFGLCLFLLIISIFAITNLAADMYPDWAMGSDGWIMPFLAHNNGSIITVAVCAILLFVIPLFFVVKALRRNSKGVSTRTLVMSVVVWLVCLITAISIGISLGMNYDKERVNFWDEQQRIEQQNATNDSASIDDDVIKVDTVGWQ